MKTIPEYSRCEKPLLDLVSALARFYETRQALIDALMILWPHCDIYPGGTHIRLTLEKGTREEKSVYIETV